MQKSRVLFESNRYVASVTRAGFIVQDKRKGTGKRLSLDHSQFKDWSETFNDLLDNDEGDTLCKGFLSS